MSASNDESGMTELDERLPTGEWRGFFIESHRADKGWMQLYLSFNAGVILGEGTDYVGPWHIRGSYDLESGKCHWVKQYLQRHQVVYEGQLATDGIRGRWRIGRSLTGSFHIWPSNLGMLTEDYLHAERGAESYEMAY